MKLHLEEKKINDINQWTEDEATNRREENDVKLPVQITFDEVQKRI